jgi:hypothetical protein
VVAIENCEPLGLHPSGVVVGEEKRRGTPIAETALPRTTKQPLVFLLFNCLFV